MSLKYFIITFGCQMNKSDSERIAAVLEKIGYGSASDITEADLIVVNACSVRQSAVDRIYGQIKKSKRKNQNYKSKFKIILTGCLLDADMKKLKEKVDYVLPIKALKSWPRFLKKEKYFYYPNPRNSAYKEKPNYNIKYLKVKPKYSSEFSAFVPISTGCDNFCSYCVVPYTRGPEYSRPSEEIITEVKNLIKKEYKEIILLGQNVNSYSWNIKYGAWNNKKSKDQKSKIINFPRLLKMINDIPGNFWIRFLTSHPKDFSDELIRTIAKCNKVCEYIHLPIQSGNDEILKAMNRKYTVKDYKNLVQKIRHKIPGVAVSTDVIVGFPGETKRQFQNTVKLFKEIKFDMAYIAQYSPRAGTAAFKLKDNVPREEKKQREKILTEILRQTALENNQKYIGKTVEILVEKPYRQTIQKCHPKFISGSVNLIKQHNNKILKQAQNDRMDDFLVFRQSAAGWLGKTRTFKTVKIQPIAGNQQLTANIGDFVKVKIIGATSWGLKGKLF